MMQLSDRFTSVHFCHTHTHTCTLTLLIHTAACPATPPTVPLCLFVPHWMKLISRKCSEPTKHQTHEYKFSRLSFSDPGRRQFPQHSKKGRAWVIAIYLKKKVVCSAFFFHYFCRCCYGSKNSFDWLKKMNALHISYQNHTFKQSI